MGDAEVKLVKENLGFDPAQHFVVPDEVLDFYRKCGKRGADLEKKWNALFDEYRKAHPELAKEFEALSKNQLPEGWKEKLPSFKPEDGKIATRQASGRIWLLGSATPAP